VVLSLREKQLLFGKMSAEQQQQQHHATEKNEPSVEYISMEEGSVSSASAAHNDASSSLKTEKQHLCSELLHFFHHRPWHKKLLTMSVIVSCIYVFIDLVFLGYIEDLLEEYIDWMERHIAAGVFAFIGIFIVSTREYDTHTHMNNEIQDETAMRL
jgi:hypothetical protein